MSKNKLAPSSDYFLRFDKKIVFSTPSGKPYRVFASLVDKKGNLVAPIGINVDDLIEFSSFVNVAKNTDPKYDTCRIFRKGDIVEIDTHGRDIAASMKKAGVELGKRYTVTEDESDIGRVSFIGDDGIEHNSMFFWLKLVTPAEEMERYIVIHNKYEKYFEVCWKDVDEPDGRTGRVRCRVTYWYHQPPMTYTEEEAKAAAEAECARLNANHRKEQK